MYIYGSKNGSGQSTNMHVFCVGTTNTFYQFGSAYGQVSDVLTINTPHTVVIDKTGGYLDGSQKITYSETNFSSTYNMYLGVDNEGGSTPTANYFSGKIYSFKVWQNDNLILNLIPIKKDGVVCFLDTINGKFFYNKGTGTLS